MNPQIQNEAVEKMTDIMARFPLMILNSMTKYAPSVSGNVQDMENPGHVHRQ